MEKLVYNALLITLITDNLHYRLIFDPRKKTKFPEIATIFELKMVAISARNTII